MKSQENSATTAIIALSEKRHASNKPYIEVSLEGRVLRLAKNTRNEDTGLTPIEGAGGAKKAYNLGDGRVLIVPNLDNHKLESSDLAEKWTANWERMIKEEKNTSDKLRQLGFEAQDITIANLTIGDGELPVMITGRFQDMAKNGQQIRDVKNRESSGGTSMLFGTPENVESVDRLKFVMKSLLEDSVKLITHGLSFGGDSCNLIIKDTDQTPRDNRDDPGLFDERNQQIRFFLFDLSSKHDPRNDKGLELLDASGNPNPEAVKRHAEFYVSSAFTTVMEAVTDQEIDAILERNKNRENKKYYNMWNLFSFLSEQYNSIKNEMIEDVFSRAMKEIGQMPKAERLKCFSLPEQKPPTDLPGGGDPEIIPTGSKGKIKEWSV